MSEAGRIEERKKHNKNQERKTYLSAFFFVPIFLPVRLAVFLIFLFSKEFSVICPKQLCACMCQVYGFYFCWKATPLLSNWIPFWSSASIFAPVHLIFPLAPRWLLEREEFLFSSAFILFQILKASLELSSRLSGNVLRSIFKSCTVALPAVPLWEIQRPSSPPSLRMSLSGVLLRAKCRASSIEDFPCHLGRSPTWLLWDWLYPVLCKQDELGR